ncbi:MAG TPA: hypothetical protein VJH55_02495 [Candidatus Paceibacterota bacterium]
MAVIVDIPCDVCGKVSCFSKNGCRIIELEDLIFRAQQQIKTGKGLDHDMQLIVEITCKKVRSKEEALVDVEAKRVRQEKQQNWQNDRANFLAQKAKEFDAQFSEPSPVPYA